MNHSLFLWYQWFDILINIPVQYGDTCHFAACWQVYFQLRGINWFWDSPFTSLSFLCCHSPYILSPSFVFLSLSFSFRLFTFLFSVIVFLWTQKRGRSKVTNGAWKAAQRAVFVSLLQACNNHFCVCSLFAGEGESRREHRSMWVHLLCSNQTAFFKICHVVLHDKIFFFLLFAVILEYTSVFWLLDILLGSNSSLNVYHKINHAALLWRRPMMMMIWFWILTASHYCSTVVRVF